LEATLTVKHEGERLDLFVSYTAQDREWAEWIAKQLHDAGYEVALQAWHIKPGDDFIRKMHEFVQRSRATVLVLSAATLESPWVWREVSATIAKDPSGRDRSLIPVRIENCDPKGLLGPLVFADLFGLDKSRAREVLLAAVEPAAAPARDPRAAASPPADLPAAPGRAAPEDAGPTPAGLRRRLRTTFDAAGFVAFSHDNFPRTYERFALGMSLDQQHTLLLDYCRRAGLLGLLSQLLDDEEAR